MDYEVWKDIIGKIILLMPDHTTSTASLKFVCHARFNPLDEHGSELPYEEAGK